MTVCISADSLKLLAAYFNKKIPGAITENTTYDEIMKKLFTEAFSDLSAQELSGVISEGVTLPEFILQHMAIVPQLVSRYLQDNPLLENVSQELEKEVNSRRAEINSVIRTNDTDKYRVLINDLASQVGADPVIVPLPPAQVDRAELIRLNFYTTVNQDAIWDDDLKSYKSETTAPLKRKVARVQRQIIKTSNASKLRFKLVTLNEIDYFNNPQVDRSLTEEELSRAKDYVLVLTDPQGEIVLFNEQGNVAQDGTFPVFTIRRKASQFNTARREIIKKKVAAGYTEEQATQSVDEEIQNYISSINGAIDRHNKGEKVAFSIDLSRSSQGALELHVMLQTPLSEIANLDEIVFSTGHTGSTQYPKMRIPGYSEEVEVMPKTVDSLPKEQIEVLFQLLTNWKLKKNGVLLSKDERLRYIRQFIRMNDNPTTTVPFYISFSPKGGIQSIKMGHKSYNSKQMQSPDFRKKFEDFLSSYYLVPAPNLRPPTNYQMLKGDPETLKLSVTAQRQIVETPAGIMMAVKPETTFALFSGITIESNAPYYPIIGISSNGDLQFGDPITYRQHVINTGISQVVPQKNKRLQGTYPYLAFNVETIEEEPDVDFELYQSLADASRQEDLISKLLWSEETLAMKWMKDSGWLNVLNLVMKDEFHTKGPKFVASFMGNTISLYKGSNKTDLYHEVFHAYFRGLLTETQRQEIYDSLRTENKGKTFTVTVKGKKKNVSFDTATKLELEEFLAEEFRKYARNKSVYNKQLKSPIARFFERLKELFQMMFGNRSYAEVAALGFVSDKVTSHFHDLYTNQVDLGKFVAPQNKEEVFHSIEASSEIDMNAAEVRKVMMAMQALVVNFTDLVVNPSYRSEDLRQQAIGKLMDFASVDFSKPGAAERKQKLESDFNTFFKNSVESAVGSDGRNLRALEEDPWLMRSALEFVKRSLEQRYKEKKGLDNTLDKADAKMLKTALEHFGDLNVIASPEGFGQYLNDDTSMIGIFLNNYSPVNLEGIKFQADETENTTEQWNFDRTGVERTLSEDVDAHSKFLLSTLTYYDPRAKGGRRLTSLKTPEFYPFEKALVRVALILSGVGTDEDKMYLALEDAAKGDRIIRQLLSRLGRPDSKIPYVQDQWGNFWRSMNKADIKVVVHNIEKKDIEGEDSQIISTSGQTGNEVSRQIRTWDYGFYETAERQVTASLTEDEGEFSEYVYGEDLATSNHYISPEMFKAKWGRTVMVSNANRVSASLAYLADPIGMLADLGIRFTESSKMREALLDGSEEYGIQPQFISRLYESIANRQYAVYDTDKKIFNLRQAFGGYTYRKDGKALAEQPSLTGWLNNLAELALAIDEGAMSFTNYTAEGERMSSKSFHSSLSVEIEAINNATHYDELRAIPGMEHYDYRNNPEIAANLSFVYMFNLHLPESSELHGVRNKQMRMSIEHLTGTRVSYEGEEKGIKSISSDEKTKFNTDFSQTLEGRPEILRSEAKSTSYITVMPVKKVGDMAPRNGQEALWINNQEALAIFEDNYAGTLLYDVFKNQIESELVRIARVRELNKKVKEGDVLFNSAFLQRGGSFIKFEMLLSASVKESLLNLNLTKSFTIDSVISNELKREIEEDLKAYFTFRASALSIEKSKSLVLTDTLRDRFALKDEEESVTTDRLFKMFVINNYLNNLNYTATFLGDPANYNIVGEDFHKRIAGKITTGRLMRHSQSWYNYVNSEQFNRDGFTKSYFDSLTPEQKAEKGLPETYQERSYGGYLQTAFITEPVSNSVYRDYYADVLGIPKEKYSNMDEADAACYVSFDTYRLLAKSHQEWSPAQEAVYQAIVKGEPVNPLEIRTTFPIRKYQYYGPVWDKTNPETHGLQLMSFHKYSVVPLIPSMIKGKPIEKIHEMMMEQGIDYVTFKTASKLAEYTRLDSNGKALYDEAYTVNKDAPQMRQLDTSVKFVQNTIHVRYLKSVVQQSEGFHGTITFPSQMRKINLVGLYDKNGTPLDYTGKKKWKNLSDAEKLANSEFHKWNVEFIATADKLLEVSKDEMIDDLGLTRTVDANGNIVYEGNTRKLAKYLEKQLRNKNLTPDEISFMYDSEDNLISDFSLSLNASKIEEVLVKLADDNLRAIQMKGDMLVQMSGTMLEDELLFDLEGADVNQKFAYGSNSLATYYGIKEDGTVATEKDDIRYIKSMEVKISLQGDFVKLIYEEYQGEPIIQYFKEELAGQLVDTSRVDFDATLARLNEAMKDPQWKDKYRSMLTLPATRIPTSQFSMLESMEIKEFVTPLAGPIVILPSEIVAKSGADFDIDKLFALFPHLMSIRGNLEYIEYDENVKETRAELIEEEERIRLEIEEIKDEITLLYKEKSAVFYSSDDIAQEVKDSIKDLYEESDRLVKEIRAISAEAKKVYAGVGKYETWTMEDKRNYHHDPVTGSRAKVAKLQRRLDSIKAQIKNAFKTTFTDLYTSLDEQIEEAKQIRLQQAYAAQDENIRKQMSISKRALENKMISLLNQRITNPAMFKSLAEPNSVDFFKGIAAELEQKLTKSYNKYDLSGVDHMRKMMEDPSVTPIYKYDEKGNPIIGTSTIFDYRYNLLKHQENSRGLQALGIAAVMSTYYALFTQFGATLKGLTAEQQAMYNEAASIMAEAYNAGPGYFNPKFEWARKVLDNYKNYTLKFDHNKINGKIALGFVNNVENRSIQDVIGQLINGFVDVAKKPWVFNVQGNTQNINQLLFMVVAGMSVENAVYMSSLPLVIEYNTIKAEMEGLFSNLDRIEGSSPMRRTDDEGRTKSNQATAREEMINRYKEMLNIPPALSVYDLIHVMDQFDIHSDNYLKDRVLEDVTSNNVEEHFALLMHYFEIEKMADDITAFTMATKYDTEKLQNLSEYEDRLTKKEELFRMDASIDYKEWYREMIRDEEGNPKSILGAFEADQFVIDFLAHRFGIRNNLLVTKKSIEGMKANRPKGTKVSVYLMGFKEDFMFYLYQNAFFRNQNFNGYTFVEDSTLDSVIDVEGNIVHFNREIAEEKAKEVMNEYSPLQNIFPTTDHFLRYYLELEKINTEYQEAKENGKDKEYVDKNYLFLENNKLTAKAKVRAALWRSRNNVAFFTQDFGVWRMIQQMKSRYADSQGNSELAQMFDLIHDLKPLIDVKKGKANIYLENLENSTLVDVYKQNLKDLKNSQYPEVAELFAVFDHIAILQSGASGSGMTNMNRIIDQSLFLNVIEEEISTNEINLQLERGMQQYRSGKKLEDIEVPLLDQFIKVYYPALEQGWASRKRGMNLMVDFSKVEGQAVSINSMTTNKVRTYTKLEGITDTAPQLTIDNLIVENEQGELEIDMDFIEEASLAEYVITTSAKFYVGDPELQKQLNKILLDRFGIDNTGSILKINPVAIGYTGSNLTIALAEQTRDKYSYLDEQMANRSTKAIGKETPGVALPSVATYYEEYIKKTHPERLAGGNKKFASTDKVWIFGSSLFETSWKGSFINATEWSKQVQATFDKYHKKEIDKAIEAGVRTFYVGTSTGVDKLAYDYLVAKNYLPVPKYLPQGKFFEFAKVDDQTILNDPYVDIRSKDRRIPKDVFRNMFEPMVEQLIDPKLMAEINELRDADLNTQNADKYYHRVYNSALTQLIRLSGTNPMAVRQFKLDLISTQGASLEFTSTKATKLYRTYLEHALLDLRNLFVSDEMKKNAKAQEAMFTQMLSALEAAKGMDMNYVDGSGYTVTDATGMQTRYIRSMLPQFKGKSTMDLIISGDRTRTTRSGSQLQNLANIYGFKKSQDLVGFIVPVTDTGEYSKNPRKVYVRITGIHLLTQEYQDRTWHKEGWEKSVTDRLVGDPRYPWAIEFEFFKEGNITLEDIKNVKSC